MSAEVVGVLTLAADLLEQRDDFADPVEAILAAQGHERPAADAPLARRARYLMRKQDDVAARVVSNLGGGVLLTDEQMADLMADDWVGIDFDHSVCPTGPSRLEWAWDLRWCALDVRWAERMDMMEVPS